MSDTASQHRAGTEMTPAERRRFLAKIGLPSEAGCMPWLAATNGQGYGVFWLDRGLRKAHRLAYELFVGPIPEGLVLDHLCRVRGCVNPIHLEPVTQRVNTLRGQAPVAANAVKTHCPAGHEYDGANLYTAPNGWRGCRECHNARSRVYGEGYREANREVIRTRDRANSRAYREANRDKISERNRAYHEAHREEILARQRAARAAKGGGGRS